MHPEMCCIFTTILLGERDISDNIRYTIRDILKGT